MPNKNARALKSQWAAVMAEAARSREDNADEDKDGILDLVDDVIDEITDPLPDSPL